MNLKAIRFWELRDRGGIITYFSTTRGFIYALSIVLRSRKTKPLFSFFLFLNNRVCMCGLNTTAWNYFNYPLCENTISRVDCNRMKIGKTIIQHRNIHLLLFTRQSWKTDSC